MSAQKLEGISGLVAVNSLMAMVGGTLTAMWLGKDDPGFIHNGPLAGLVAVCAYSDIMHPVGALVVGAVAGMLFVWLFTLTQNRWKIDDVLGVWPLHGLCGTWGGSPCRHFRPTCFGRHRRGEPDLANHRHARWYQRWLYWWLSGLWSAAPHRWHPA
ncbi:hypothetical protein [Paludibacterium denitrificans]|uniref:hypothetical protein n=1 Tax=Paludibacterium denitrificans TaxID=2675226 RepID=UPI00247823E8|nr:hypothetical protein [Paludibacterium denitrificans]